MYTVNYTNFFDFGVDVGDAQLEIFLDGSSPSINLSTPIQFFGRSQHTLFVSQLLILTGIIHDDGCFIHTLAGGYEQQCSNCFFYNSYWFVSFNHFGPQVNKNGIISFQLPFTEFRPRRFPLSNLIPLIAPFWDDVDIRRYGNIFFRETSNASLLQIAYNQLQEWFPSSGNFTPTTLFIATWDRVAHYVGVSQVSAYMTVLLLVTISTHSSNTAWKYTWSAIENCFINDLYMSINN